MFSLDLASRVLLMFDQRMYIQNKNLDYLVLKFFLPLIARGSRPDVFLRKGVLKVWSKKFTGKYP